MRLVEGTYLSFPKVINVELTDKCPLQCPQCFKSNNLEKKLDINLLFNWVDEAAENGTKSILLSGGEPLLYPYLNDLILMLKKRNIYTAISTSGVGATEESVSKLYKNGLDRLYVSINASDEGINSLSRDGYDHAIYIMKICKKLEAPYRLNWVARHDNIANFGQLITLAQNNGAEGIDVLSNKPNIQNHIISELNKNDYNLLLNYCKKNQNYIRYQACFFELKNKLDFGYKSILLQGCPAGLYSMTIFSDGSFSMCPHIYTGIRYNSIKEYWNEGKDIINHRKVIKKKECYECEFNKTCNPCPITKKKDYTKECLSFVQAKHTK